MNFSKASKIKTAIALGLLWFLSAVAFGVYRFSLDFLWAEPLSTVRGIFIFALTGAVSAVVLLAFLQSEQKAARIGAIAGYTIIFPVAIWFATVGGLFAEVGVFVYGFATISIGVVIGWFLGIVSGWMIRFFNKAS